MQHLFCGNILPKYFSHACLVLLPKIDHPNKLSEFRPISLSNFSNKIIPKIFCFRLAGILPQFISENQSGFVKGRSISENIMLAQEITHRIKQPNECDNVVIKSICPSHTIECHGRILIWFCEKWVLVRILLTLCGE